jgi:cell division transport system permease protein
MAARAGVNARRAVRPRLQRLSGAWMTHHARSFLASLGQLVRHPLASGLTIAVIGIALALPGALYVVTRNLSTLSAGWHQSASISVFLRAKVTSAQAAQLGERLRARPDLAEVQLITPDQALSELRGYSGFAEAIEQLSDNPLPFVLVVRPKDGERAPADLSALRHALEAMPEVDFARVDTQWVSRFEAILRLAERGVLLLGGLLALAVLLVVGNTIRLEILNRRDEIEVMELVGATASFIRRPFLYTGAWYGLLGGLLAWLLVALAVALLQGPVSRLALLYRTSFPLTGIGPLGLLAMLGTSALLGVLGSWLSVGRHLASGEPA